jgi:hypothetical protein
MSIEKLFPETRPPRLFPKSPHLTTPTPRDPHQQSWPTQTKPRSNPLKPRSNPAQTPKTLPSPSLKYPVGRLCALFDGEGVPPKQADPGTSSEKTSTQQQLAVVPTLRARPQAASAPESGGSPSSPSPPSERPSPPAPPTSRSIESGTSPSSAPAAPAR